MNLGGDFINKIENKNHVQEVFFRIYFRGVYKKCDFRSQIDDGKMQDEQSNKSPVAEVL